MSDALFAGGGLAVAVALAALLPYMTGVPRWTAIAAAVTAATMGVANAVEHCAYDALWVFYVLGALGLTLSSVALGLALLMTGAIGRWRGLLFIVSAIGLMRGFDRGGMVVFGAAWIILGLTLLLDRRSLEVPAPAAGEAAG